MHAVRPPAYAIPIAVLLAATFLLPPPLPSPASPPTFTSLRPDGGEVIPGGAPYDIVWNATHDADASLLTTLGYSVSAPLAYSGFVTTDVFPTGGATYAWPVPLWNTTAARVQVCATATDGGQACRESASDFAISATPPYFDLLSPSDRAKNVPLTGSILVGFNPPPNTADVTFTITPAMAFALTWSPGLELLTLVHATPFLPCTTIALSISVGAATRSWTFSTYCLYPHILSITPPGSLMDPIVVVFDMPMDAASVTWTIAPLIGLTSSWSSDRQTLSVGGPSFPPCTTYTFAITAGRSAYGDPLVPGLAPNPISFTTPCPPGPPRGLAVLDSSPDVVLTWRPVTGATGYKVYETQNRFTAFGSWTLLTPTPVVGTQYTHAGALTDGLTHYYVVRATDGASDGPNSTMGVKTQLAFAYPVLSTSIRWFSLPANTRYARASDIASRLGTANVDLVGKWDPALQRSIVYYYARGGWRGTDFDIRPGDGLYLGTRQTFTWVVMGTDADVTETFTFNGAGKANVNWVSVPYTGVYGRASDIANELSPAKVTEIGVWDAATQTAVRYWWTGTAWAGTDFTINPGAGVYVVVASSFTWTSRLITPAVP